MRTRAAQSSVQQRQQRVQQQMQKQSTLSEKAAVVSQQQRSNYFGKLHSEASHFKRAAFLKLRQLFGEAAISLCLKEADLGRN